MCLGYSVVQSVGRLGDGDDEDEIEEQLEGCGGAVRLVGERAIIGALIRAS